MSVQPKQAPKVLYIHHYQGDYIRATRHLSAEERGVYRDILDHIIELGQDEDPPSLPDDDRMIANIANVPVRRWRAIKERLCSGPLAVLVIEGGRISQARVVEEILRAKIRIGKQSTKGVASGASRKRKSAALREKMANHGSTTVDTAVPTTALTTVEPHGEPVTSHESLVTTKPDEDVLLASSSLSGDEQIRIVTEALASVAPHLDADERTVSLWLRDYSDPWWIAAAILESQQWISTARSVGYVTGVLRGKSADGWPPEAFDLRGYVEYRLQHPAAEVLARAAVVPMRTKL